jgi:excisionase family DNA binding protein
MEDKKILFSIGRAADYLGVSIDTLRRWEKAGKVTTLRSPGGHRYFEKERLDSVFGKRYERIKETVKRKIKETPNTTLNKAVTETYAPPTYPSLTTNATPPTPISRPTFDRPVRDFAVPQAEPIRIIQEVREVVTLSNILTPADQTQ